MFAKKVKEVKQLRKEAEIVHNKSNVILSSLRKSFRKTFQDNLKIKIKKPAKIRFSEFDFGNKKNNQDAAIIYITSVNDAVVLDNHWSDDYGNDVSRVVPFSIEWFEQFCLEQSEILDINIKLLKK